MNKAYIIYKIPLIETIFTVWEYQKENRGRKRLENLFQEIMVNVRPETIKLLEGNISRTLL